MLLEHYNYYYYYYTFPEILTLGNLGLIKSSLKSTEPYRISAAFACFFEVIFKSQYDIYMVILEKVILLRYLTYQNCQVNVLWLYNS